MKTYKFLFSIIVLLILASCNIEPYDGELTAETPSTPKTCEEVSEKTATALSNFALVKDSTGTKYSEACNSYKEALQDQMKVCNDSTGTLKSLIDELGDCMR